VLGSFVVAAGTASLVAVIDDDAGVTESFRFLLEIAGFRVASYRSAAEFLASSGPAADCLIIDHHMPQMTGLELIARLNGTIARRKVMLITGSNTPDIRDRAAALGIAKVAEKPLADRELLDFVNACADHG
jgi:two-component system, LuxR family, response regulator FixJ